MILDLFVVDNRATVLAVEDTGFIVLHFTSSKHCKTCFTYYLIILYLIPCALFVAWIVGNNSLGIQIMNDESEQVLGIIVGISQYCFNIEIKKVFGFLDKMLCDLYIRDICRIGNLPDWKFGRDIIDHVITVTPKIPDSLVIRFWKMDQDTESCLRITCRNFGLVKSVRNGGFQVVFF